MKATTKRALSILISAALLVMALVFYAILIRPEYAIISGLRGQLASKSTALEDETNAISQVRNLISQYQGVAKLGDTLSLALPSEEAVSEVVAQINALTRLSGLTVQSLGIAYFPIKPSATKLSFVKGVGTLRLNLKLFGSYAGLKNFLGGLEKNIKIMDVKTLKIEQLGKTGQDLFSHTLEVDTYYQAIK